jgi:alanyl-tRNA synthetase
MTSSIRAAITQAAQSLPFKDKLYMSYTYMFGCKSTIKMIGHDEKGKTYVKFMETIFHPQGGGQPCDLGEFEVKQLKKKIEVLDVQKEKIDGRADLFDVRHYVSSEDAASLEPGQDISMTINPTRRLLNARLHTCGHLIAAMAEAKFPLKAIGGHHIPHQANVQFEMTDDVQTTIDKKIEEEKAKNKNIGKKQLDTIKNSVIDELKANLERFLNEEMTKAISERLPVEILATETGRKIQVEGYEAVGCGGTHLGSISEITEARISGISMKKGELKVSYEVAGEADDKEKVASVKTGS